jgi:alpha-keto-acid decarboxylase
VLLIGDGAAQLTVQEVGTFSPEGLSPVIVVVNNDGYTVERAIHGETAPYSDIVSWSWTEIPNALGVANHLVFRAKTYANSTTRSPLQGSIRTAWCSSKSSCRGSRSRTCLANSLDPCRPEGSMRR